MNWYFLKEATKHQDLEIDLITSGIYHSIVNHDFGSNIRVWKVNIRKKHLHHWSFREMLTYLIRGYFLARKLVAQRHYDLIHAVFGFPSGLIAYLLRKKVPYVVSMRGSDDKAHMGFRGCIDSKFGRIERTCTYLETGNRYQRDTEWSGCR